MLDSSNWMLALGFSRRRCAPVIAALLVVVPASAEDPAAPNQDKASAETDEPTESTSLESGTEAFPITGDEAARQKYLAALSAAGDLQALRIEDIEDLSNYTPNLEIHKAAAATSPTLFIRGIGLKDYNGNAEGSVAVYQDGVNINSPVIQFGQLFDLEAIDVLRGPQGSVNARNATAGAIMIRSAMPDGEFGVSTSLTYGNYDNKEVEAAINIPLIEDMLSMRVSGKARWRDGYTKNQCAGWNPAAHIDPGDGEPFRVVSEDTNQALYWELEPTGQYENGELRAATVQRQNGGGNTQRFVYLNHDLAIGIPGELEAASSYASGVQVNRRTNPFVLTEDLVDVNGDPVFFFDVSEGIMKQAVAGTPVAYQTNSMAIVDVDDICIVSQPGKIATTFGDFQRSGNGTDPFWQEGNWQADRVQPGLEDFAGLERWTNNIDNWAARVVLLFEPLDNMEWMANVHGTQNRGDSAHLQMLGADTKVSELGFFERQQNGFSESAAAKVSGFTLGEGTRRVKGLIPLNPNDLGVGGGNPYSGFYNQDGLETIDAWGINGRGFWDLGAVIISLLYDYEWYDRVIEDEGDANPGRIFPVDWSDSAWQTTEDLRIEGEGEGYKWTTGFFFLYEELDATNVRPNAQQQIVTNQHLDQTLTSWAPYASGEIELVEEGVIPGIYQLTLGGGVRYNQEKKEYTLQTSFAGAFSGTVILETPFEKVEQTWKEWTGDAQLSYTPFSNEYGTLLSYLKYGHGFKGGQFNQRLRVSGGEPEQDIDPVDPEFIDAVEFGVRTRWFDDRLILNAAVFRYWYDDLQVFDVRNEVGISPTPQLLNGNAKIRGAEAELHVKPVPGLLISANFGWLDSEYKSFVVTKTVAQPRDSPLPVDFDYRGNRLVAAPKWNFAGIAEFEIPLFGWGSLIPRYDVNWRSKVYFDPQMRDPISQGAYWLHNTRIAYRTPGERIELAFWVSNLLDEEYKIDVYDLTREGNTILEAWGEPRTYGVTLSLNW